MAKRRKAYFQDFESRDPAGKFVRIATDMMDSQAWHDLSVHARYLYLEMKRRYNGDNCRTFNFPHSVGRKLMSGAAFTSSVNELIEKGFITCIKYGRINRIASEYRFVSLWYQWPNIRDFDSVRPGYIGLPQTIKKPK